MEKMFADIVQRDPQEKEFHQAVQEVMQSVKPVLDRNPEYRKQAVIERITEPERVIMFRVPGLMTRARFMLIEVSGSK